MRELLIGTYNIKNNKSNRLNPNNWELLKIILEKEKLDILGTQELTFNITNYLKEKLTNYNIYGSYRFGNGILEKLSINENNVIIIKNKVVKEKTYKLPFMSLKSINALPRIANVLIFEDNSSNKICIINTHLDHKFENIQIKQLKIIKELVLKYSNKFPVILMGDFNMDLSNKHFNNFIKDLSKHIKRVDTKEPTWNPKNMTLDHVFIPNDWNILNASVINNNKTKELSDHNLIKIKVEYKEEQ